MARIYPVRSRYPLRIYPDGSSPPDVFGPDDIANLIAWYKSDAGVTITGSGVSTWANQAASGSNYNLTQGTDANRPVVDSGAINGYPALRGDGSNDYLEITGTGLNLTQNVSGVSEFYVVKIPGVTSTNKSLLSISSGTSTTAGRANVSTTPTNKLTVSGRRLDADSNQSVLTADNAYTSATWYYLTAIFDWANSNVDVWLSGVSKISNTSFQTDGNTSNTASQRIRLFQNVGGVDPSDCSIAELVVYQRAVNSTERGQVETYLKDKYGL